MSAQFTRNNIITWMIGEAKADHNGLTIEPLSDKTYGVTDQELGARHVITIAAVSKALTRWARAVTANREDYCNYWVVAAAAVTRGAWDQFDYDATISTRVLRIACGESDPD